MSDRYVAFLRAVNTPPRWVKMARLRDAFVAAGYGDVATHIASGNVIFSHRSLPDIAHVEQVVAEACGFSSAVFLRSEGQIAALVAAVPWKERREQVEVAFLERVPDPAGLAAAMADTRVAEAVAGFAAHVFLLVPNHRQQGALDRHLGMSMTRRALATVEGLAARYLRLRRQ